MNDISKTRFDAIASYARHPLASALASELRWRWVDMTGYHASPEVALVALEQKVDELLPLVDQVREQGDEHGPPVDFFHPVRATDKLNADFVRLASEEGYSPARQIIEPMMHWYEDADGNFVEQFQTTGFDAPADRAPVREQRAG